MQFLNQTVRLDKDEQDLYAYQGPISLAPLNDHKHVYKGDHVKYRPKERVSGDIRIWKTWLKVHVSTLAVVCFRSIILSPYLEFWRT